MAAPTSTKFQVNFKLVDGTLINIYAENSGELEGQLATIQDTAALIVATSAAFSGAGNVSNAVAAFAATPVAVQHQTPQGQPALQTPLAPGSYHHGVMVWRESKPGAPKAWKGWFCPSPKGTPDQCEPKFVR